MKRIPRVNTLLWGSQYLCFQWGIAEHFPFYLFCLSWWKFCCWLGFSFGFWYFWWVGFFSRGFCCLCFCFGLLVFGWLCFLFVCFTLWFGFLGCWGYWFREAVPKTNLGSQVQCLPSDINIFGPLHISFFSIKVRNKFVLYKQILEELINRLQHFIIFYQKETK